MYNIYETEAFVIRSQTQGEHNQNILFFSREFGLIWASVFASKKVSSKHKGFLQKFSFIKVFLVVGKHSFRITGGELLNNIYFDYRRRENLVVLSNIFVLLEKFLVIGEKDERFFNVLKSFYLKQNKITKIDEIRFLVDFLVHFGYLGLKEIVIDDNISQEKLSILVKKINKRLEEIL